MRRIAAVGLLSLSSLVFAIRFSAPPSDRFYLDDSEAGVDRATETTEVTRPTFSTLTTTATIPPPPLPPGVTIHDSDNVRFGRGSLQLRIWIEFDQLVDIEMIQTPHASARARQINTDAHPILRAEALELQDYRVHIVSGATETTYGWSRALRNALIQANFCVEVTCAQSVS